MLKEHAPVACSQRLLTLLTLFILQFAHPAAINLIISTYFLLECPRSGTNPAGTISTRVGQSLRRDNDPDSPMSTECRVHRVSLSDRIASLIRTALKAQELKTNNPLCLKRQSSHNFMTWHFTGEGATNVIPDSVHMGGTMRALELDQQSDIRSRMIKVQRLFVYLHPLPSS